MTTKINLDQKFGLFDVIGLSLRGAKRRSNLNLLGTTMREIASLRSQ